MEWQLAPGTFALSCTWLSLKGFYSVVPLYIGHFSHTWKPRCMPSKTLPMLASRGLVPCIIYYSNGTTELCINVYFLFVLYHTHLHLNAFIVFYKYLIQRVMIQLDIQVSLFFFILIG